MCRCLHMCSEHRTKQKRLTLVCVAVAAKHAVFRLERNTLSCGKNLADVEQKNSLLTSSGTAYTLNADHFAVTSVCTSSIQQGCTTNSVAQRKQEYIYKHEYFMSKLHRPFKSERKPFAGLNQHMS